VYQGKITQREVARDLGYDFHDPETIFIMGKL
jgi:alanine dehydrogenase